MSGARWMVPVAAALLLAGCGDPNADIKAWMAQVQARTKPEVEPLPVMEPPELFVYARAGLADPFAERLGEDSSPTEVAAGTSGLRPDPNRRREALEAFPLDSLRMVGTLARDNALWALIRAPDQTITRIAVGNYMGQNHGRVVRVGEDTVHLVEIVATGPDRYVEREAALAIVEQ